MPGSVYSRHHPRGKPLTVAQHKSMDRHLVEIWCNRCMRKVSMSVMEMPDDLAIIDIPRRYPLVCSQCGQKDLVQARPDVAEGYEVLAGRTGFNLGNSKL